LRGLRVYNYLKKMKEDSNEVVQGPADNSDATLTQGPVDDSNGEEMVHWTDETGVPMSGTKEQFDIWTEEKRDRSNKS
jgi:hypothetical protein